MRFFYQTLLSFFLLLSWESYARTLLIPPLITSQKVDPIPVDEDQPLTLQVTDFNIFDLDSSYPDDFTLTVIDGANYSVLPGNIVMPDPDYNGSLTVNVTVNDGTDDSPQFNVDIEVNAVNDAPSFDKGTDQIISEDAGAQNINNWATSISEGPADENSQTLTFQLTSDNPSLFSDQPSINPSNGRLTYTPAANANGVAEVEVTLKDDGLGDDTFGPLTFFITVNNVNDPPSITGQIAVNTNEDIVHTIALTDLVVIDADGGYPTGYTLTVLAGTNYTPSGNTITPAINFNGTLFVNVQVADPSSSISNIFPLEVQVAPVNDPPSFVNGANQTILEDAGAQSVAGWATAISTGPPDENTQTLTFSQTNDNPSLFSVQPAINPTTGTLSYTPAANASGEADVTVTLTDSGVGTNAFTTSPFTITVNNLNDVPSITGQNAVNTNEDVSHTIVFTDLLVSDPDDSYPTGFTLTVLAGTNYTPSGNTITPAINFNGTLSVNVQVSDPSSNVSNIFQLQVQVAPVNDPPSFVNGANQTILEDAGAQSVAGWATAISKGPPDENTQTLTFSQTNDNPSLFSVPPSINVTTGTLTYTPAANTFGEADVTVTLTDSGLGVNAFTTLPFTITVTPDNDKPIANNDATTTNEDTPVDVNVVSNDTDVDGTVNASSVDLNTTLAGIQNTNMTVGGAFSVNSSGVVTFTPNQDFTGLITLNYTVNDNNGLTSLSATISITVIPTNDNPIANNDATSTSEETNVTINVLTNDTDPDGNGTINASTVDLNPASPGIQSSTTLAGVGTFTVNASGIVSFTPVANFNGLASATYTVNDNMGASSNVATISITVNAINDLPVASADATTTDEDVSVTINVVSNDVDPDGSINTASVDLNTGVAGIQNSNTIAAGTFTVNSSGVVTYVPTLNFIGTATLNYRVNDNEGSSSNIVAITIMVNAVNDPPVANNDAVTTNEDTPITINVVTNDTDVDGTINISTVDLNTSSSGIQNTATISGGTVSVNATGVVTFTPTINFYGTAVANYLVNDNSGLTSATAGTITFTVNAVNDTPFASNDITSSAEDEVVTINVVANDVDIDGSIDPATVDLNTTSGGIQNTITITAGTFTVNASGVVTYTPTLNFNGNATINYTVRDNLGGISGPAIISISVSSINSDPVANNDAATTNEDAAVSFSLVANDNDPDGSINAATVDLNPASPGIQNSTTTASGTFVVNPSGMLTFTPTLNFNGSTSITYAVNDNIGATSNAATITVTVTSINDAPIANNDTGSGNESVAITISVVANDTDVDGTIDPATVDLNTTVPGIQNTATTAAGSWSVNASGVVTFTSINNFNGAATLIYRVNDNGGVTTGNATITINVNSINDAPVANNDAATTNEDVAVTLNLVTNDTDEENNLSASTVDLNTTTAGIQNTITTSAGVFTVNSSGVLTYTPALNFNGPATNTYTVNDTGGLTSNVATITITVTPVNDVPVAVNDAATTNEDNAVIFRVTDNDTDVEGALNVATIDLNTTAAGIQNSSTVVAVGTFSVNATGDVTFTPVANFFGTATLSYRVNDNSGVTSNAATITVTVNPVNDPPSFDPIADVIILENAALQTVTITGITPGVFESQLLLLTATSGNTALIQPTVNYNGSASTATITFKPTVSMIGVASITVKAVDPGLSEFSRTFQVQVTEINDAPTLDPITFTPSLQEDAALQNISLTGITAGPGENQALTVSVSSNNAALFEILDVVYASPATTGTLRIKPKANVFGSAQISVRVQDSGPNSPAPSVNFIIRTINLVIQPVNDLPVFLSDPIEKANIGEVYTYNIKVKDVEGETLTLTAPTKPAWATLLIVAVADTAACHCNYKLTGIPPVGSGGAISVIIQVKDPGNVLVEQPYTLVVNTRPTTIPFSVTTNEDVEVNIASKFATGFVDSDGNALSEVQILTLPKHGTLKLPGGTVVTAGQNISAATLSGGLVYLPIADYYGLDTINWNASDGTSYALNGSYINFVVSSVNDVPIILAMETDSLLYKSGSQAMKITKMFDAQDVDDDSLVSAEVRFVTGTFSPPDDILTFTNTQNLTGSFNADAGILSISGKAPISEYDTAIRAIQYKNIKSVSPEEGLRTLSIIVSDGQSFSEAKTRLIYVYFIDVALDIPDGFTPADDSSPNNKWEIQYLNESPSTNPELKDAVLKIYNKRGLLLFETNGFKQEWDGKVNGEFVPADTYFYTIDLKSSSQQTFKGTVTILR